MWGPLVVHPQSSNLQVGWVGTLVGTKKEPGKETTPTRPVRSDLEREREGTWRLQNKVTSRLCYLTTALILIQLGHISHRAVCTKHTLSKAPNLQDCLPDKITPRQIIWGFIYFTHDIYGINYASLFFRGNVLVPMLIGLSQSISWSNVTILWMPIQPIQRVSCKSVLRSTLYKWLTNRQSIYASLEVSEYPFVVCLSIGHRSLGRLFIGVRDRCPMNQWMDSQLKGVLADSKQMDA